MSTILPGLDNAARASTVHDAEAATLASEATSPKHVTIAKGGVSVVSGFLGQP
jgi:hypothetical protein